MMTLVSTDANSYEKDEAAATIRRLHWYVDVNQIVIDYFAESDEMKKATLANAYRAITGQDINSSRYRD